MSRPPDPAPDPYIAIRCVDCGHMPGYHEHGACEVCPCTAYAQPSAAYLAAYDARLREAQTRFMEGGDAA